MIQRGLPRRIKRGLDLTIAAIALLWTAPLFGLAFTGILVTMGPPILFRQSRVGHRGQVFRITKFRTMRGPTTGQDADRITPFGRCLRATSLDELPQLLDVLRGTMSLVGPRPHRVRHAACLTPDQQRRHDVLPGLTGWAQIHGRNGVSWPDRIALDLWYVDHWSPGLDLQILWRTLPRVLARDGVSAPGHATMPEPPGPPETS